MDENQRQIKPDPEAKANPLSKLCFCYLNHLFPFGKKKKTLNTEDLFEVPSHITSKHLCSRLEKEWEKEHEKHKSGKKASLMKAFLRTFGLQHMLIGMIALVEEAVKVTQPILLGGLISYFSPSSNMSLRDAYLYAMGVSLCAIALILLHHPYFFYGIRTGMLMRISACSLLYKKSLKLSNNAMNKMTTGHIVNLMSNDVNRFDLTTVFMHYLWLAPLQAIVILVLLWLMMGPACLAGFAMLLLLIPMQSVMSKLFAKFRQKIAVLTDERVKYMNEVLTGMRVIKMYCWEKMFSQLVGDVRSKEVKRIKSSSYARAVILAPNFISGKLIAFLTFLTLSLTGYPITSKLVFTVIALYEPIRLNATLYVPIAITFCSESLVTIHRLQEFLLQEELDKTESVVKSTSTDSTEHGVSGVGLTAAWDKEQGNTLKNVNIEVKPGELVAVIGPVGSGKSSLLMALLGELPLSSGMVKVNGRIAYAAQQPWVFSASVRQNITFGLPFDLKKYNKVIKATALSRDLEIMPDGDETLVGDRGASLSGGQKARISLARALYYGADIYLLDDPLSAVDTAVGRHIFNKCICGYLKDKPRILVTHQLQYLQAADHIIILKQGEVQSSGTYTELADGGVDFAALLKKETQKETNDVPTDGEHGTSPNIETSLIHVNPLYFEKDGEEDEMNKEKNEMNNKENEMNKEGNELDGPLKETNSTADYDKKDDTTKEPDKENKHSLNSNENLHLTAHESEMSEQQEPLLSKDEDKEKLLKRSRTVPEGSRSNRSSWTSLSKSETHLSKSVGSLVSLESLDPNIKPEFVTPVQEEEMRTQGDVAAGIYVTYFRAGGGWFKIFLFFLCNVLAQSVYMLCDWWLSYWCGQVEAQRYAMEKHQSLIAAGYNVTNVTIPHVDEHRNLSIYAGLTIGVFLFGILRALITFNIMVCSAHTLHNKMFASIIRAPISFFDKNPVGRVLNRFSKDTGHVDELLPMTFYDFIQSALMVLAIILVSGIINPWVFLPVIPLPIAFYLLRRSYLSTSRDIKRLEGTTRSPVFSHLSASLQGLWTIRAFGVQPQFEEEFDRHQDLHSSAYYLFLTSSRWFAIRLDILCAIFVIVVTIFSVIVAERMSAGLVGLTVSYALTLMGLFQWCVRQSAETENQMTSVERMLEYSEIPSEAALESTPENKPPPTWPPDGGIEAEGAKLQYTVTGPVVLKNLKFSIQPREKIGIVGRTGAGKSSLITMLFRLSEPYGQITIDGEDITKLGLHDLRSKISIIPQDPVLFMGTVRKNLDPFCQYTDIEVWDALEQVQMKTAIKEMPTQLDHEISEGGTNFSIGQRQLFCLSRAVLRKNNILILDEATANVDPRTDAMIQQTIREKFQHCTVLTIAHRLHTIMDSDRIMVLDAGEIKEFGEPYTLLQNKDGLLYSMVQHTGASESESLIEKARQAATEKTKPVTDTDDSLSEITRALAEETEDNKQKNREVSKTSTETENEAGLSEVTRALAEETEDRKQEDTNVNKKSPENENEAPLSEVTRALAGEADDHRRKDVDINKKGPEIENETPLSEVTRALAGETEDHKHKNIDVDKKGSGTENEAPLSEVTRALAKETEDHTHQDIDVDKNGSETDSLLSEVTKALSKETKDNEHKDISDKEKRS